MNKKLLKILLTSCLFIYSISLFSQSQSMPNVSNLDKDYLESLPKSVQEDILDEMNKQQSETKKNLQRRPSSKLLNSELVREWEEFKNKKELDKKSERYGLRLFKTMQSSFMPLNEPNFGSDYVLDYGDIIKIYKYGRGNADIFDVEIGRDGSVILPDIGKISLAGLNFEQASNLIKITYEASFIGSDVVVSLSEIRDINILVTGSVEFPGIYTLSGNSNLLQALNIVGGVKENGSLRNIVIKRKGEEDKVIDLYEALIFGDINSIPSLMSGDAIYVESVENLVRAGYGFNNVAIFELKNGEKLSDLIRFSGGLKNEVTSESLKVVRFENAEFVSYNVDQNKVDDYEIKNLDSVYAYKEKIGTIKISGYVKHPGNYSISTSDRMLDKIETSAAYIDSVDAKQYDAFIFTSANAIRNLKLINDDKSKICFCVGSITEKIVRQAGYNNTISAGGTVNALKNIILNSDLIDKKSFFAYFCGDNISSNLDTKLRQEGYNIDKIINYTSEKITDLNEENNKIITNHPPDIIFIYSKRSAESFVEIVKKYALNGLMTESRVLCISEKVLSVLKNAGWKKLEIFEPGEEIMKLEA